MPPTLRLAAAGLEHLQHTRGDYVATHGVASAEQHADEADSLFERRIRFEQRDHGTDDHDAVDEVATRHEWGVQDGRYATDDLIAGETGQQEDIQSNDAVNHGNASVFSRRPWPWVRA